MEWLTGGWLQPRKYPPSTPPSTPSFGSDTRATKKTTRTTVKKITKETDDIVAGPVTRLLSTQTGLGDGFVLKSIKTIAGTVDAYSVVIEIVAKDGTTIYMDGGTAYS